MLEALGIPDSDKKKQKQKKRKQQQETEVIELITPPRVHKQSQSLATAIRPGAHHIGLVDQALELSDDDDDSDANGESRLGDQLGALLASSLSRVNALVNRSSGRVVTAAAASDRHTSIVDLTSPDQQTPAASSLPAETVSSSTDEDEERLAQRARDAILAASSQEHDVDSDSDDDAVTMSRQQSPATSPIVVEASSLPSSSSLRPRTLSSDHECDALLDDLLLTKPLAERIAAARERSAASVRELAPQLTSESSSTSTSSRVDCPDNDATAHTGTSDAIQRRTTTQKRPRASASRPRSRERLVAFVRMERSLDASATGAALKTALQTHMHNGKALAVELARPLDCALSNVIQWQLCHRSSHKDGAESTSSRVVAAAIYFHADAFIALLQQSGYAEVRRRVESLQCEILTRASGSAATAVSPVDAASQRTFVVVEGMDKCLIALTKKTKQKQQQQTPEPSGPAPATHSTDNQTLSFRDVHEMAFQLFMDTTAHTQFTVDVEDTAAYTALLTRELLLAYGANSNTNNKSAIDDTLENVPRLRSVRATATGATTNAFANAWLRMLQLIPGVSEPKAQRVLDHFPTLASLLSAYNDPNVSRAAKQELLATVLADSRMSRALSKRIFHVFCIDDPDTVV